MISKTFLLGWGSRGRDEACAWYIFNGAVIWIAMFCTPLLMSASHALLHPFWLAAEVAVDSQAAVWAYFGQVQAND